MVPLCILCAKYWYMSLIIKYIYSIVIWSHECIPGMEDSFVWFVPRAYLLKWQPPHDVQFHLNSPGPVQVFYQPWSTPEMTDQCPFQIDEPLDSDAKHTGSNSNFINVRHHVIKTVPRVKDPMDHLNGKTIQKLISQHQFFQHDKFDHFHRVISCWTI